MDFGFLSLPVITLSVLFGYSVFFDVSAVLFHPVEVPLTLEQQGYSRRVMSARLANEVRIVKLKARTVKDQRRVLLPDDESAINTLGGYFDFLTPVRATQELMGLVEFSFVGDVVTRNNEYRLSVRGRNNRTQQFFFSTVAAKDPEELVRRMAIDIVRFVDPYVVASYYYEATRDQKGTDYGDTLRHCATAMPEGERHWAHNLWGLVLLQEGRPDEAIERFRQALRLRPDFVPAVHNWGNALMAKGEHEAAIARFREALALDSQSHQRTPHAYTGWATALRALGRLDEAAAMFREAMRADPRFAEAYNGYGDLLRQTGDLAGARAMFERAADLDPLRTEFATNLASLPE